jgi:hypothetical protein
MVLYRPSFSGPVRSRHPSARSNSTILLMLCQAHAQPRGLADDPYNLRTSMMAVGPTALTGASRRLFQATMRLAELPSTPRNSASQEIRPASHTRTRTTAGTTSCRTATIGQLPRSRVEEVVLRCSAPIKRPFDRADTTSRLGARRQVLCNGHINAGFAALTSDVIWSASAVVAGGVDHHVKIRPTRGVATHL